MGGGQSDCFQPIEAKSQVTKEIITICNSYNQKILFSTKSDTYYDVPVTPDNHNFQLSVSNLSGYCENNVPRIDKRIKFFDKLKNEGFKVGIRIQPFIPEITDFMSIIDCFSDADHFTIEGLKLVPQSVDLNKQLLELIGLCKEDFTQMGLLNLYPDIRLWYYQPVLDYLDEIGVSYSIADNDLHYLGNNNCCCGDALIFKSTDWNNTSLLQKYKNYDLDIVFDKLGELKDCNCRSLFTSNRVNDCVTVKDFYCERFNKKRSPFSPKFQYYEDTYQTKLV